MPLRALSSWLNSRIILRWISPSVARMEVVAAAGAADTADVAEEAADMEAEDTVAVDTVAAVADTEVAVAAMAAAETVMEAAAVATAAVPAATEVAATTVAAAATVAVDIEKQTPPSGSHQITCIGKFRRAPISLHLTKTRAIKKPSQTAVLY